MSMYYDVQSDAVGFNKCPRLYSFPTVIFGKSEKSTHKSQF